LLVSGKYDVWLNEPCSQLVSENLWHVSHVVGKPAWATGVVAVVKEDMWHAEHGVVGTVRKLFAVGAYGGLWHVAHVAVRWAPASAKYVAWLNGVARSHVVSELLWQVSHVVGRPVWFTGAPVAVV
jgi:hypothetical protein